MSWLDRMIIRTVLSIFNFLYKIIINSFVLDGFCNAISLLSCRQHANVVCAIIIFSQLIFNYCVITLFCQYLIKNTPLSDLTTGPSKLGHPTDHDSNAKLC